MLRPDTKDGCGLLLPIWLCEGVVWDDNPSVLRVLFSKLSACVGVFACGALSPPRFDAKECKATSFLEAGVSGDERFCALVDSHDGSSIISLKPCEHILRGKTSESLCMTSELNQIIEGLNIPSVPVRTMARITLCQARGVLFSVLLQSSMAEKSFS